MNTHKKNKQPTTQTQKPTTPRKIFIGVSWPYANGNIHIGHLAGQYVVCDVFARYHRLKGNEVLMVSGSDSHGAPVIFAAEEQGTTPEKLSEKAHNQIVETYKKLGFIYENYTTTRTKNHAIVAQNIFLVLNELGFLTIKKTKQYYDPKAKRFLPDRYIRGTCPHCKATNARGDECPECGNLLDPEDLIEPHSTLSDAKPELRETEHYYLDLSKVQGNLSEWLKNKSYWRKWVREFTLGWLRGGLQPRCVTRDFNFGVPVPVEGWEGKVLYVWIEAVVGYLSAAIEWSEKRGTPSAWEDFWKDPSCKHYYFIAGGNVPFHTIIWPTELIGYNGKYSSDTLWGKYKLPGETKRKPLDLPYDVPANNILTYRGKKMSKGDKVGVTLDTLLADYEPDVIRYFFVRYAPENQDREFIWKDFIDANNNELVANVGNFINRVLSFTASRFGGKVPVGTLDSEVNEKITRAFANVSSHLEKTEFVKATEALLNLGHFANKYFNDQKPWETVKTDPKSSANALYNSIQLVQALRILFKPFLPFSAEKLRIQLNLEGTTLGGYDPQLIPPGHILGTPQILFPKLEYTEALEKDDNPTTEEHVIAADTTYDFRHIDEHVVIGKITEITKDAGRKVTIDIGEKEPTTVVCNDTTLEKGLIVPVALPETKIRSITGARRKIKAGKVGGVQSNGMLCGTYELEVGEEKEKILRLPKEFGTYLGEPLASVRSITFEKSAAVDYIPTAWTVLENLHVKKNRSQKLDTWIHEKVTKIQSDNSSPDWITKTPYTAARKLHEKFNSGDIPGSAESMVAFILEKGDVPNISSLVDLYNTFSALTGISIGAHDIDKIKGTPRLQTLENDLRFRHAATNTEDTARKGEFAYIDDSGILCRLDTKQGNRTIITPSTRHVLVLFQGNDALDETYIEEQIAEFRKLVDALI